MKLILITLCLISSMASAHTVNYYPGAPLQIITIGHPTLTQIAEAVPFEDIKSEETQNLIDDMFVTMKKAGGVGLAAPQVNVSKRIFVMKPGRKLEAIINPTIEYVNEAGTKNSREGCLSIPGRTFKVKRYKKINFSYYKRTGEYVSERATGFRAIVAQHEYDHLNGILISDFFYTEYIKIDMDELDTFPMM